MCSKCQRWGHTTSQCISESHCATCTGPHWTQDHNNTVKAGFVPSQPICCINCFASGIKNDHLATDRACTFALAKNNKKQMTSLLDTIKERRIDGKPNPWGLTKIRSISPNIQGSTPSSTRQHKTQSSKASTSSMKLASSADAPLFDLTQRSPIAPIVFWDNSPVAKGKGKQRAMDQHTST